MSFVVHAFVTESLSEDVSVLVFSQTEALAGPFVEMLERHGLQVTRRSSDIASLDEQIDSQLSSTWYKVFWIEDIPFFSLEKAKRMVKIFQMNRGLSYVVMHQPFTYVGDKRFETIGQELVDINAFFTQRSPYTTILSYKDVFTNEFFSLNYQQIVSFLHRSKFPLNVDSFSWVNEKNMIEGIVGLCFDPRGGKRRVVVGKKEMSARSLLRFIQSEWKRRFSGESVEVEYQSKVNFQPDFSELKVPTELSMEDVVGECIVQAKFHYTAQSEVIIKGGEDLPKPFVPHPVKKEKELVAPKLKQVSKTEPILEKTVKKQPSAVLVEKIPLSIRETAIQIKVSAPAPVVYSRPSVLIPVTPIPEIKRSSIVLRQLSSLEKPITVTKTQIPHLSSQVVAKVKHEQQTEAVKQKELKQEEDIENKKNLEKKIAKLFIEKSANNIYATSPAPKIRHAQKPVQVLFGRTVKIGKWYKRHPWLTGVSAIVGTTAILTGIFFSNVFVVQKQLLSIQEQFVQGSDTTKSLGSISFAQKLLEKQLSIYSTFLGQGIFSDVYEQVETAQKLTSLSASLSKIRASHVSAVKQMLGVESGNPLQTLTPTYTQAENVYKELSLIEAELKEDSSETFLQSQLTNEQQKEFISALGEVRKHVLIGQQMTELASDVLGSGQTKTIAIVLQDAQELRATGGFVEGVMVITLKEGRISDTQFFTSEQITNAVNGEVSPPEEVKQYLGESQWFIRDANWNPNFETTAKQIKFFVEKGMNSTLDGVIGLNSLSLQKIVGVFGSVEVAELNDQAITEQNFAERQQSFIKSSLLKTNGGQGNGVEFLPSVLKALTQKIKTANSEQVQLLLERVSEQLKQSEIVVSMESPPSQTILHTLGWTGSIVTPPCPSQLVQEQCLVTRIFQVDSNVGVNKVNYAVKKKIEHSIELNNQKTVHRRVMSYENSSTSNSWPAGAYKDYVRWYVPLGMKLRLVSVNGKEIPLTEVKQYEDKNSLVWGAYIEVLPLTTTQVVLEYEENPIQHPASFVFFNQKQPGTDATPTKVSMFYDQSFTPTVIAPQAEVTGEKIEFSFWGGESSFAGVKFR